VICHKNKFIFVHIPKTAGVSIELALFGGHDARKRHQSFGWDQKRKIHKHHATIEDVQKYYASNLKDYFKFAFVRNPWDRAVSDWLWFHREFKLKKIKSFKNYLLSRGWFAQVNHLRDRSGRGDHFFSQYQFIANSRSELMVDFVGRFENLQADFDIICEKMNLSQQKLPHSNKGDRKHYTAYYNDETRRIVAEKYAKDIEYFGYKFG